MSGGPTGPLKINANLGQLTIGGVTMVNVAWQIVDLKPLWEAADQRGTDRLIPGVAGTIPYRRRVTLSKRPLQMIIVGFVDRLGAVQTNPFAGLEANIAYLNANVVAPTGLTDGTRAAVLTMPSGATRTANIHVTALKLGNQTEPYNLATLDLEIPVGALT